MFRQARVPASTLTAHFSEVVLGTSQYPYLR